MPSETVEAPRLQTLCSALLRAKGVGQTDADFVADTIVEADLRGVHSHGSVRLPRYIRELQDGITNPAPTISTLDEGPAFARVDGGGGLGPLVGRYSMNLCIDKALSAGSATVTAGASRHFGSAGYYALMAEARGLIGLCMTVASPRLAPTGGTLPLFGNNPLAMAVPSNQDFVLLVDFASGSIAAGRLELAAANGTAIPPGVARDLEGKPTTDPNVAHTGTIVPIGEHKGYGLTLLIEILAGLLGGAPYFGVERSQTSEHVRQKGIGHFFMAIDPARFMPIDTFKAAVDHMVQGTKSSPKMPGVEEIFLPGEQEANRRRLYVEKGIPLDVSTISTLNDLAAANGVSSL
jgi:LDH2 family malate/lactate/ureidoglycolate dehydrogenase